MTKYAHLYIEGDYNKDQIKENILEPDSKHFERRRMGKKKLYIILTS